jgi:RNA polymerase sigma-70 factor (ECF subfamily)
VKSIKDIDDPARLKQWLTGITVYTAREWIRYRMRRRWLRFVEQVPEAPQPFATHEVSEATRAAYATLSKMPEDERIPFCLRFVEGMDLAEIAAACDLSVSTTKRRLKSAEERFVKLARSSAPLVPFLEAGRWGAR